nr:LAGLIDADG family homing endonuclease [Halalkaliarchaeum desulfuricum]
MTSFQSSLGEDPGIAEELAEGQRQISIAEFFEKNKHMLGFDSGARGLVTAVKEGVDNSLTWSTPFVYRSNGETKHEPIGRTIDQLIESNEAAVQRKRGGDLEKLRVDDMDALSFDDGYDLDFRRISSVFRHRVNSDIYRLTVEGGREVELTDYHSVFVLRDGEIISVETSSIEEGDYVVLPDTEWGTNSRERIDVVSELCSLPDEKTEPIGLYGVDHLLDQYENEIREQAVAQYRMSDFRKCDRLPFHIVRELDLDIEEYEDCEIGYRFGKHHVPAVLPVTAELGEFLGLYTAEGCTTGSDSGHEKVYLSLGAHETELIEYASSLVESVFGVSPTVADAHETARNVTISSKMVGLLLSDVFDVGDGARNKRIPRFVFDFPHEIRERFVLGYGSGDGYPTSALIRTLRSGEGISDVAPDRITFATASDELASGFSYLCSSIGYDVTRELQEGETRQLEGSETEFGESHLLYVRTNQSSISKRKLPADEILDTVDDAKLAYNLDGRQTRVDTSHALALADGGRVEFRSEGKEIAASDLTALPVTRIERIDYDGEWVYDVSVPGDENFMAGTSPLACHNSLDATEEAGILPDIYVEIEEAGDYYRLVIEDNGPGITKEEVPKVFGKLLYGSRFHKREQSLTPDQKILIRRNGDVEFVSIGVLCDAYLQPEGEGTAPVPDDIEVPSFDRETHELTWQPVTHAIRHETDEPTYEITLEKGRTVEVTGNHSLFSVTKEGETTEVDAGDLEPGDALLTPRKLPGFDETVEEVNLLEHIDREKLEGRRLYVYGFDREELAELETDEKIRKKPKDDSSRKRYYYRYDGVEILRDSLKNNYLEKGYLPVETVLDLGWEQKAADCELRTYKVGGEETRIPVTVPIDEPFVELLAYYISEGHAGDRQVGFTFGTHESELIEATERAVATVGGSTTTVERERNSTRVKAFGSPLALFLESVCGDSAKNKHIPEFIFRVSPSLQRRFIAALYQGDGSDSHPSNELSHTTTSETLARQLSVLWNMQGILASTETQNGTSGYTDELATRYRTKVYGEDAELADVFERTTEAGEQGYKRVPTSLLESVQVGHVPAKTVPDTIPGLLLGAGVGSSVEHAAVYQSLIERALDGEYVEKPRYVSNLIEMGLLDEEHRPTSQLEELWEAVKNLQGLTDTDMYLLPVREITETEPPEYVYDISVPGATGYDENFVVVNEGAVSVKNSRGQQGIGISAAVLYSQLTSGEPAKITSRPKGASEAEYVELIIDTDDNEPEIKEARPTSWDRPHGTRIELEMEANMRARSQLHQYIKHTAVVNPHARIELREPKLDEPLKFERATDQLPAETKEIRPHPHGVELGTLIKMLEATDSYSVSGFLQSEFTRVGGKTTDSIVAAFRDRHFGREMSWTPPRPHEDADVEGALEAAVVNKGKEATAAFAARVTETLADRDRVTHFQLRELIEEAADAIEEETGKTFGETVREKALDAAWGEIVEEGIDDPDADEADRADASAGNRKDGATVEETDRSRLTADLYALLDEATSKRKDDATVEALSRRIARKFASGNDRHRVTRKELRKYVDDAAEATIEYDGATVGDTARENVTEKLWSTMVTVPDDPPKVNVVADDRNAVRDLLEGMRETNILAPPTDCLAPITAELVEAGLRKEFDADFYAAATRDAEVHGGDPFIVEAGIAYGGDLPAEGNADVLRFANRVPLVYQRGACATTDVVKRIGWRNYGLDQPGGSGVPNGPAVIMVHVASTNVPFTSESKDAIANVPEIEDEIELAIREASRELKSYLNRRRSMQKRREKQDVLGRILPEMAQKVAEVTGREPPNIDGALARIMNNVSVERTVENGSVTLHVENYSDRGEDLEITEIVSREPSSIGDGASAVEVDGEYFLTWSVEVAAGEEARLSYDVDGEATFDINVDGIDAEKLTIEA